jgi:hypothetical protein
MIQKALTVVAATGGLLLAGAAPALAQDGAFVQQCSDFFPGASGTIITTPSGNFNFNCSVTKDPSASGGSTVLHCSEFGPFVGNIVFQTNGEFKFHCKFTG